jgi:hypothetical protein
MAGRPGKLDEISASIGELRATTTALTRSFDRHCGDDDRRHAENVDALAAINRNLGEMHNTMRPLANTVKVMEPIVAGYAISQWKRAGAVGLAVGLLSLMGLLLEKALGAAFGWAVERLLH